jgi:hypothetical protein
MFSGCKDFEKLEIENSPKLRMIQGYGCKLDELILNKFPDLIHVYVPFNRLRKLEIKDCEEIEVFFCNNNNLKELDISGNSHQRANSRKKISTLMATSSLWFR